MRKLYMILLLLFAIMLIASCTKEYYSDDIDDIIKIKEFLVDADCDKGVAIKYQHKSSYNNKSGTEIHYCDEYKVDRTTVDEYYKGMGNITSVRYTKNNNKVVIESEETWLNYYRIDYYTVQWYEVYTTRTYSFYTKSKH